MCRYTESDRRNTLLQILRGTGEPPAWPAVTTPPEPTRLHQDCNVYVSELVGGQALDISLAAGRQAYLLCIDGSVRTNDTVLAMRDAAELRAADAALPLTLAAAADGGAHLMLIEMALA